MSDRRSIEELVDEMIQFTIDAGGDIDMYIDTCERTVEGAKSSLDDAIKHGDSQDEQIIYDDALEFLRIAKSKKKNFN